MSKNQKRGEKYELISKQILILKNVSWEKENITFESESNTKRIEGISKAKHQIDIHLISAKHTNYHLICECKGHAKPINKSLACSFVTVIKDIQIKNKKWKIIPVLISNKGFQSGAIKILKHYNIYPLFLENVSNNAKKLTITESSTRAIVKIKKVILDNDKIADVNDSYVNYERGDYYGAENIIGNYILLDRNNKEIKDAIHHKGYFKTGRRKIKYSDNDIFLHKIYKVEIKQIEGEIIGYKKTFLSKSEDIIISPIKVIMKDIKNKDALYYFYKNGTIKKINKQKP